MARRTSIPGLVFLILLVFSITAASPSHKEDDGPGGDDWEEEHDWDWNVRSRSGVSYNAVFREELRRGDISSGTLVFKGRAPVKKIRFRGLNMSWGRFNLMLQELPAGSFDPAFKRVYSIDPTGLDFEYAEVTAVAMGSQLFKCSSWDYRTQTCQVYRSCTGDNTRKREVCTVTGGWRKVMNIVPGQEYTFIITPDDPGLAEAGAIYCNTSPCVANSSLLMSRDSLATPEPNQPNTIDGCPDGTSGAYMTDESVENITVTDLNSSLFRPGDTVRVDAWVYCWDTGANDNINFVYTNDTEGADWRVVTFTDPCPAGGFQLISKTWVLDDVLGNHSIRVINQYNGQTTDTCGAGSYDDNDDVTILVGDYRGPSISSPAFNETTVLPGTPVMFNVSVWDRSIADTAVATFMYPNGTRVNRTLTRVYRWFWENSTDLEPGEREARAGTPPTDYNPKTCSGEWGFDCGTGPPETGGDNTFDTCPVGTGSDDSVNEIYINSTAVIAGDTIAITCEFDPYNFPGDEYYIYYYNAVGWTQLRAGGVSGAGLRNRTTILTAGSTVGTHWVRCIVDWDGENDECANVGSWYDNDDVSFLVVNISGPDNEGSTPFVEYQYTSGQEYSNITQISLMVTVSYYDPSGSVTAGNKDPDLEMGVYNGTGYTTGYNLSLNETYTGSGPNATDANFTLALTDPTILTAWKEPANRKLELRGINLDTEGGNSDAINWTGVWVRIEYENGTEYYHVWQDTSASGTYNVTAVYANDTPGNWNSSAFSNVSFISLGLTVTETLQPNSTNPGGWVTVYGHLELTNGTNASNHPIGIYLNGTLLNAANLVSGYPSNWWNLNWSYRKRINITNNAASLLPGNYSVSLTVDTSGDGFLPNGHDLRIVYWNGTDAIELDRVNETPFSSSSTQIWFALEKNISAGSYDDNYYIYYGNPSAGNPPENRSSVYFFWEDFEDGDISDWTNYSSGEVHIQQDAGNWVILKTANNDPNGGYVVLPGAISDYEVVIKTKRINENGGRQNRYAMEDASFNGYGPRMYDFNTLPSDFAIERRTGGSNSGNLVAKSTSAYEWNTWMTVKFRKFGTNLTFELYNSSGDLAEEISVLDSTYTTFDRFVIHGGWEYYTDDILVRRYVSPEPTVSAGREEFFLQTDQDGNYNYTFMAPTTNGIYPIKVNATYSGVYGENTTNLTVGGVIIDVTLHSVPIDFGNLDPGVSYSPALGGAGYPMVVTIESTTNVDTNLTLKGTDFTAGAFSFSIGNLSYSNATAGAKTNMASGYPASPPYADWINIPAPGGGPAVNRSVYFWVSIPIGQTAGTYNSTVTVKVAYQ
jgi:hypothetical protein